MHDRAIAINDLQPIARRMRDREEEIGANKKNMLASIGTLVGLAAEQGADILLAKTKLGKMLRWSEWLKAHVPNLPEDQAAKYERVATEQLKEPRQCFFAFLPPAPKEPTEKRMPPAAWETASGYLYKLTLALRDNPPSGWPKIQRDHLRQQFAEVSRLIAL